MKKLIALFAVVILSGCDYVPHEMHEIETIDGSVIKLSCPKIDPARSTLAYSYGKECYLVN